MDTIYAVDVTLFERHMCPHLLSTAISNHPKCSDDFVSMVMAFPHARQPVFDKMQFKWSAELTRG